MGCWGCKGYTGCVLQTQTKVTFLTALGEDTAWSTPCEIFGRHADELTSGRRESDLRPVVICSLHSNLSPSLSGNGDCHWMQPCECFHACSHHFPTCIMSSSHNSMLCMLNMEHQRQWFFRYINEFHLKNWNKHRFLWITALSGHLD